METARSTARLVHLPGDRTDRVSALLVWDGGYAWDEEGRGGTTALLAAARLGSTPPGVEARWWHGPDLAMLSATCPSPGAACLAALQHWMVPPSGDALSSAELSAIEAGVPDPQRPLSVARSGLDRWLWEGLSRAGPALGDDEGRAVLRPEEVEARDRRIATRDGAVVGVSGPVSTDEIARVMAASRALSPRIHATPSRPRPGLDPTREAWVFPAEGWAWALGHPATSSREVAAGIGLMGLTDPVDGADCAREVPGWGAPWAWARQSTAWVGSEVSEEGALLDDFHAWVARHSAFFEGEPDLEVIETGRRRWLERGEASLAEPSCALAWTAAAVLLGRPDPLSTRRAQAPLVDPDEVREALLQDLPPDRWRLVVAARDPERVARLLQEDAALGLDRVRWSRERPWDARGAHPVEPDELEGDPSPSPE